MHVLQTAMDLPPCLSHVSSLLSPDIVTLGFNQLMPSFSISYSVWLNQTRPLPLAFSAFLLMLYHVHMPTFIAMQNAYLWVFYHITKEAAEKCCISQTGSGPLVNKLTEKDDLWPSDFLQIRAAMACLSSFYRMPSVFPLVLFILSKCYS